MLKRILNSQSKTITFAAILLAGSAFFSRILGLVRDRLLAGHFGAGEELDIYFAAFRIPDFIYGIFIMGGIAAVFLPVFAEYFRQDEKEAWQFTSNLLNCFLLLLILLCGLLAWLSPWIINLVAPGFSEAQRELTVALTRLMFLSPVFFGLSSIFSGVLHYFNRFLVYSLAPVLYNLGIIFGILFLVPRFGLRGLAYGVILGALLHWLIQLPAARVSGYKYSFFLNFRQSGLLKVFRLMIPRTIGAAAYHLNLIVITAIASTLTTGSIAVFNFSNNLQYFPVGLIGVSFALAAFPALSRNWVTGAKGGFLESFSSTFCQILFLITPVSLLMFLLRSQIVRLILGTGEFGWLETRLTAACLGIFCLGIGAGAFIPFLSRTFYSFQNTKTPVIVGLLAMALNIILSFSLVGLLANVNGFQQAAASILRLEGIENIQVVGLPLALSLAAIFQFVLLLFFLKRTIRELSFQAIWQSFKKVVLATLFMALSVYSTLYLAANFLNTQTYLGLLGQAVLAGLAGVFVFLLATYLLGSPELRTIKSSVLKQFEKS